MLLLDTSAYSHLSRGDVAIIDRLRGSDTVCVSLITVAELLYGFKKGDREEQNKSDLRSFLSNPNVMVLEPSVETATFYADAAYHAIRNGRSLSNNDLWIAALAREHDVTLVTYDRDFTALEEVLGKGLVIL